MKIGFIGAGNMGGAILRGYVAAEKGREKEVYAFNRGQEKLDKLVSETGVNKCSSNAEVVDKSDMVIFAVKPIFFSKMFEGIKDNVRKDQIFVSIMASITIEELEEFLGSDAKIVRSMPNTPAMIGMGMASLSRNANVSDEEMALVKELFDSVGQSEEVEERLIPAVTALSGSSPAYVYMFIEAMADAGVAAGMPRDKAYKFAAQAVKGSAAMVLETGKHPGELKDMVCSPGGITIECVRVLEEQGMRGAVFNGALTAARFDAQK